MKIKKTAKTDGVPIRLAYDHIYAVSFGDCKYKTWCGETVQLDRGTQVQEDLRPECRVCRENWESAGKPSTR